MDDEGSSTIDIGLEVTAWADAVADAPEVCRRAIAATFDEVGAPGWIADAGLGVLLTGDARLRGLNAAWRGQDRPTNVLSFPSFDFAPGDLPGGSPTPGLPLGDLALAFETVALEAAAEGRPVADHLTHLIVHGTLHLLGFDHQEAAGAAQMEQMETRILTRLGVPDPYADECATQALEASS